MTTEEEQEIENNEDDEGIDLSPFWFYLQTEQGQRVVEKLIEFIETGKKSTLLNSGRLARLDKYLQFFIILAVVIAVSVLTFYERFTPSLGVLFGSLVGYIYGRKP